MDDLLTAVSIVQYQGHTVLMYRVDGSTAWFQLWLD